MLIRKTANRAALLVWSSLVLGFAPDLVRTENRINLAMLVKF